MPQTIFRNRANGNPTTLNSAVVCHRCLGTQPKAIQEMLLTTTSERQGRAFNHDTAALMENKRRKGHFRRPLIPKTPIRSPTRRVPKRLPRRSSDISSDRRAEANTSPVLFKFT